MASRQHALAFPLLGAFLVVTAAAGCGEGAKKGKNPTETAKVDRDKSPAATSDGDQAQPDGDKAQPDGDEAQPDGDKAKNAGQGDAPTAQYYFDRKLKKNELKDRSLRDLSLMRNTIFARGGNTFRKVWLNAYFSAQPWYAPRKKLDKSKITDLDWDNVKIIAEVERSFTKKQLKARKSTLLAEIGDGEPSDQQEVELKLLSRRLGKWIGKKTKKKLSPLEDPSRLDEILELSELEDMSRKDLRLVRNTIYARHGYQFKSFILEEYFMFMDWYKPNPKFKEKMLSKVDWKNIKLIKSLENQLGGPMRDNEHGEEIGWFDGA